MRRAREGAGLSLEDLTRRTKIPRARLAALESADVPKLPAAVYIRGFVKAYAVEVGLSPDETADEYLASVAPPDTDVTHAVGGPATIRPSAAREYHLARRIVPTGGGRLSKLTTFGAAIGLLMYVVFFNRQAERQPMLDGDDNRLLTPTPAVADVTPATPSIVVTDSSPMASARPLDVELLSQGPCWLVLTVDGERVLMRLLQAGERLSFAVSREALLRVGDPGAMSLTINGQNVRELGPPGRPVDVTISRENFKELLSS
jgi:transcriptional regulator with XRE-family HTH domain